MKTNLEKYIATFLIALVVSVGIILKFQNREESVYQIPVVAYKDSSEKAYKDSLMAYEYSFHREFFETGKKLFKSHCQACHLLDVNMTGPALIPIFEVKTDDEIMTWLLIEKKSINETTISCLYIPDFDIIDVSSIRFYINERIMNKGIAIP